MASSVRIAVLFVSALGLCALSCARSEPPLGRQDPAYKIPAMKSAVGNKDDSAVRLYAIIALEKLTGQTLDYEFYADRPDRQPAIQRWKQWLTGRRPTTQPATRQG
jgi:hypothetical protein